MINETQFKFYQERKISKLGNFIANKEITIHAVINSKTNYDPFYMIKKGTKRHNSFNNLKYYYKLLKAGNISRVDFKLRLSTNKYLEKYSNKF